MDIRNGFIGKIPVAVGMFVVMADCLNHPWTIADVFQVVALHENEGLVEVVFMDIWLQRLLLVHNPENPNQPNYIEMTMEQKCTPIVVPAADCIEAESIGFRFRIPNSPQIPL